MRTFVLKVATSGPHETFLSEVESRTQGSRPRTQKKSEAKNSLFEDRPSRGQGQECSRPRPRTKDTAASVLQKKKTFKKVFQAISNLEAWPEFLIGRGPKPQITCNDVIKNFQKRTFLWDKYIIE